MSEIKLNYHKTHFLTSAPNIRSIPEDTGIEIALLGVQMQENRLHLMY